MIPVGFVFRTDLMEKYGIEEINSLEQTEKYMQKVKENETFVAINGNSDTAWSLMDIFIANTGKWIEAPGMPDKQLPLVAKDYEKPTEISHPAFTQEFEDWVVKMRDWNDKGYFATDILSSQTGIKDNFNNGISGLYISHMMDWSGNAEAMAKVLPDTSSEFWSPDKSNDKVMIQPYVNNMTLISASCENPERSLMAIEKFMTDKSYYRLIQNGIEGRHYEIVDGIIQKPASFDDKKDAFGFAAWALRNDEFNLPLSSEDPRRYTLIEEWKPDVIDNPYLGVYIDDTEIKTELSTIATIDSQLGMQLLFGKTASDPKEAVVEYRNQLEAAGVQNVIDNVKAQISEQIG